MNRDSYTIPKPVLLSLLARLGSEHRCIPADPLPDISQEQLTEMVILLIENQFGVTSELNAEEKRIKNRLLAETRRKTIAPDFMA